MKRATLIGLILTASLASCGQGVFSPDENHADQTRNSSDANPLNILGGAVIESEFIKHPELKEAGWTFVGPGVMTRVNQIGGSEVFINYDLIDQKTLDKLSSSVRSSSATNGSPNNQALQQINATLSKFSNGDLAEFRESYKSDVLIPQNSASIGTVYRNLYGCSGDLTAGPLNPGDGAKAFVKYECKGSYQAVAEMYAAAGSGTTSVAYKASQGRLNYVIVTKEGTSFCQSKALLAIVTPGTSTISGGASAGGEIVKVVNGQASFSSSVTYNQPAKITYSVSWPDSTGSGC